MSDSIELLSNKIPNYNGNNKIIGVLKGGEERVLVLEPSSDENTLKDFDTGMYFSVSDFKEFKNFPFKMNYSKTKNHNIVEGQYIHGGQNSKRFTTRS
jgi:hypothetical protein